MRSTTRMRLEDCAAVSSGRVRFYMATESRRRVSVLGELVNVAPHLSATFALHETLDDGGGWAVSDIDSGARAGSVCKNKGAAIASAVMNLEHRTDADMRRAQQRVRDLMAAEG